MSDAISLTKDAKKPHRTSKSGAKATKKRDKGGKVICVGFTECHPELGRACIVASRKYSR